MVHPNQYERVTYEKGDRVSAEDSAHKPWRPGIIVDTATDGVYDVAFDYDRRRTDESQRRVAHAVLSERLERLETTSGSEAEPEAPASAHFYAAAAQVVASKWKGEIAHTSAMEASRMVHARIENKKRSAVSRSNAKKGRQKRTPHRAIKFVEAAGGVPALLMAPTPTPTPKSATTTAPAKHSGGGASATADAPTSTTRRHRAPAPAAAPRRSRRARVVVDVASVDAASERPQMLTAAMRERARGTSRSKRAQKRAKKSS